MILPEPLHVVALAFLEPIAHRDNQNDRRDAPRDPGHGKKGTQLITQQASDDLPRKLGQVGHDVLFFTEE